MADLPNGMSEKQQRFAEEYIKDLCGQHAAIRAGYSPRSAKQIAHELLQDERVQDAIDTEKAKRSLRTKVDQDYVIRHLTDVVQKDKVADKDKVAALKLLGQHLGMYTERQEISGANGQPLDVKVTHEVVDPKQDAG